jgi:hypothetical protein
MKYESQHILFSEDIDLHNDRHVWLDHPYADWHLYLKSLEKFGNYRLDGVHTSTICFCLVMESWGWMEQCVAQKK